MDRRYDLHRILTVIDHYRPDIAVLQEVSSEVPRSRRHRQAELIADILDFRHLEYGPNVRLKQGSYGNATLSRYPIGRTRNVDLSFGLKKSRGALYTEIRVRKSGRVSMLHLVNIHLGLSGVERRWQTRRLLEMDELSHPGRPGRTIVAGDTNDWNGALWRVHFSRVGFRCATGTGRRASLTFPSWQPVSALDRVFFRGALSAEHHFRGRLELNKQASDHLPVIVDFALDGR